MPALLTKTSSGPSSFTALPMKRAAELLLGHVAFDLGHAPAQGLYLGQGLIDAFPIAIPVQCQIGTLSRTLQRRYPGQCRAKRP